MSWEAHSWVNDLPPLQKGAGPNPSSRRFVMRELADKCDQHGETRVGVNYLATRTQLHRTSVMRVLDHLVHVDKLIHRTDRPGTSTITQLCIFPCPVCQPMQTTFDGTGPDPAGNAGVAPCDPYGPVDNRRRGSQHATPWGSHHATTPVAPGATTPVAPGATRTVLDPFLNQTGTEQPRPPVPIEHAVIDGRVGYHLTDDERATGKAAIAAIRSELNR